MNTPTNHDLIAGIETYLGGDRQITTCHETLADVCQTIEGALGAMSAAMQQRAAALTSPLTGDAQERYNALIAASIEHYQAWHDLAAIIDTLHSHLYKWRDDGANMANMVKAYAAVFGFELPNGFGPDELPNDENPFSSESIPW